MSDRDSSRTTVTEQVKRLMLADDGPLTRELLREPGRFGLGQVPSASAPDHATRVVCGYCATGCGLIVHERAGEATNLSPSPDYPVNLGMACPKGWEALSVLEAEDRATAPLVRDGMGRLATASWPRALREFVSGFREILDEHGPESCAFLSTGQIVTEEMFFLGALARFGLGFGHGDGNTRQCMATAVTAYKESFGFDAPPYSYDDFEASDVIVLVGSNLCIAHPILWERICRNPNQPKIVVVDPRRTETAMAATHHAAIQPKADLAFFYAIANELIEAGAIDRGFIDDHTSGFEAFREHVAGYAAREVAAEVGMSADSIREIAAVIAAGKRVSFWWTMGVNQGHQAVRVAQSIIDLALITGNIGRPGTGANSVTGQCNAMGSRMFSNTTSLFAGRSFEDEAHRAEVAEILGLPVEVIPERGGRSYDQIVEGIHAGTIRGLWVVATNGAHSWIHQNGFQEALAKLDFLVVQDMYATTETAAFADLLLPAAGWGEKDGTFINSERRIGLTKKVRRAPGQALSDFNIFRLIAEAWGCGDWFDRWKRPEDVFPLMRSLSRGRPCDFTGVEGYEMLDRCGGAQWPYRADRSEDGEPGEPRRLYEDGRFDHADGRARILFEAPQAPPEAPDDEYPFILLTGRGSSAQWHTQTRTSKSAVLRSLAPERTRVEVCQTDAVAIGVRDGERVRVRSRRGEMHAEVAVRPTVSAGQVFIAMHDPAVNRLTYPAFDPHSRQPSYKHCAVHIEKADAG